jgi:hypothetical protein
LGRNYGGVFRYMRYLSQKNYRDVPWTLSGR